MSRRDHDSHIIEQDKYKKFLATLHAIAYLLKCSCGLGYKGETTQRAKDRISQHKCAMRKQ